MNRGRSIRTNRRCSTVSGFPWRALIHDRFQEYVDDPFLRLRIVGGQQVVARHFGSSKYVAADASLLHQVFYRFLRHSSVAAQVARAMASKSDFANVAEAVS